MTGAGNRVRLLVAVCCGLSAGGCVFDSAGITAVLDTGSRQDAAGDRAVDVQLADTADIPVPADAAKDAAPADVTDSAVDAPTPDLKDSAVDLPWCGNGVVEGGETCDDKNTGNGDGCSSTCQLEQGWTCGAAQPSVCTPICGDKLTVGSEACDDGNTKGGDGCSANCQPEPFHSDLVAYWTMDESSGSTAADSAGSHNGTLKNMSNAAWVSGKMGNALQFDGSNDYVDVGAIGTYDDLTIAVWVNVSSLSQGLKSIFHCDGWSSGDVHFILKGDGGLRFSLNGNSSVDQDSVYSFTNALTKWHHVAVVYKRNAKTVDFYIDGAHDVQRSYSSTRSAALGNLQIGAWNGSYRYFHGRIDDLRLYKVAVTASHIKYLAGL